ncbi:hypothetical protein ACMX2I_01480 [Bacillus sp. SW14]|uniref:hypothetical protein n=1 Tax=Bacillus sp. SW14 TaxID=3391618 RepID=UPI0039E3EBC6
MPEKMALSQSMTSQGRTKRSLHTQMELKEGVTAKGLNYEVENMQATVLHQAGSQTIHLSLDVMNIMDNVREQWGMTYPF